MLSLLVLSSLVELSSLVLVLSELSPLVLSPLVLEALVLESLELSPLVTPLLLLSLPVSELVLALVPVLPEPSPFVPSLLVVGLAVVALFVVVNPLFELPPWVLSLSPLSEFGSSSAHPIESDVQANDARVRAREYFSSRTFMPLADYTKTSKIQSYRSLRE